MKMIICIIETVLAILMIAVLIFGIKNDIAPKMYLMRLFSSQKVRGVRKCLHQTKLFSMSMIFQIRRMKKLDNDVKNTLGRF